MNVPRNSMTKLQLSACCKAVFEEKEFTYFCSSCEAHETDHKDVCAKCGKECNQYTPSEYLVFRKKVVEENEDVLFDPYIYW